MNKYFSNLVFPVFSHALDLRERLLRGEGANIEVEQAKLMELLKPENEARRQPDYGGDGAAWLGARYALVSWIDELFIVYSPWADLWNRRKLEVALYGGTSERAWKFWEQAELSQKGKTASAEALEVFFLCVMLGFRGKHLNDPLKLKTWVEATAAQVTRGAEWQAPADAGIATDIAPLRGRELLRRRVLVRGGVAAALLLALLILARLTTA